MRIEEVYGYQANVIMEAPYGAFQRMKDKATSKVKGIGGGGQREKGNIQSGEKANRLYNGFKTYVGRVLGPGHKEVEGKYLINFLQGQKLDTADVDVGGMYKPKEVQTIIMQAARNTMMYDEPTQQAQPQAGPKAKPKSNVKSAQPEQAVATEPEVSQAVPADNEFSSLSDEDRQLLLSLL